MSYANDPLDQVREGMPAYGADDRYLGDTGETTAGAEVSSDGEQLVAEERGYFRLRRPDGDDLYVPGDRIREVTAERVVLEIGGEADLAELRERPRRASASPRAEELLEGL